MSEWISVKDRLPEDEQAVLMCEMNQDGYPLVGTYEKTFNEIEGFYLSCTFQVVRVHVTHWIPLPKIPKTDDLD